MEPGAVLKDAKGDSPSSEPTSDSQYAQRRMHALHELDEAKLS